VFVGLPTGQYHLSVVNHQQNQQNQLRRNLQVPTPRKSPQIPRSRNLDNLGFNYGYSTQEISQPKETNSNMSNNPIKLIVSGIVLLVANALYAWEDATYNRVGFVAKGSNLFTEHYSGVQADVPDDSDPSTKLNTELIKTLQEADEILITGEALSHCVANTVTDVATQFGPDNVKKFTLLEDTSSNVYQCEALGKNFVKTMMAKGMRITTTRDW